jgi:hypothetical protein
MFHRREPWPHFRNTPSCAGTGQIAGFKSGYHPCLYQRGFPASGHSDDGKKTSISQFFQKLIHLLFASKEDT